MDSDCIKKNYILQTLQVVSVIIKQALRPVAMLQITDQMNKVNVNQNLT